MCHAARGSPPAATAATIRRPRPRIAATLALVCLLALPALSPVAQPARTGPEGSETWPPQAWSDGRPEALPMLDLALLVSGTPPGTPAARSLEAGLGALDDLPPEYRTIARAAFEAQARALWHQEQAVAGLSADQRRALAAADWRTDDPEVRAALDRVDPTHVAKALDALGAGARDILAASAPRDSALATLAAHLGADPLADPPQRRDADAAALAGLIAAAVGMTPAEADALRGPLSDVPEPVRQALADLASAAVRLSQAPAGREEDAVLGLAAAADRAAPILRIWAATTLAHQLDADARHAAPAFPDPGAAAPPLRLGMLPVTDGFLPPPPPLAQAVLDLAQTLGIDAQPEAARDLQAALGDRGPAAAQALAQARHYIEQDRRLAATPLPPALADDPEVLRSWAQRHADGDLPPPGSPEADALVGALPYLRAWHARSAALERMLLATEELVPVFAASHGADCPPEVEAVEVPFILAVDPCGRPSTWTTPVLLGIDVGGDDKYLHRAAAPFTAQTGVEQEPQVGVPVSLIIDLGGNDTYDAGTTGCAQAAACAGHPDGLDAVGSTAPVSVLVDWAEDGTTSTNTFLAGNHSQGYAGSDDAPRQIQQVDAHRRGHAILVEAAGDNATLTSRYEAGHRSQGSVTTQPTGAANAQTGRTGRALLVRIVGANATSSSEFVAGDESQGAHEGNAIDRAASVAALVNVGGRGTAHHDAYTAGARSQGASTTHTTRGGALAMLADVVGPGGASHDTYRAGAGSRGATPSNPGGQGQTGFADSVHALFLDAAVHDPAAVETAGTDAGTPTHVASDLRSNAATSNDSYDDVSKGNGYEMGIFIDVQGDDDYPGSQAARNDAQWVQPERAGTPQQGLGLLTPPFNGMDTLLLTDADGDLVPTEIEQAWTDFVGLWGASDDDPDATALPVQPRFVVDLEGRSMHLDGSHAFVLSAAGDDHYGPRFHANLLVDVDGDDVNEGRAASATGVPADWVEKQPGRSGTSLETLLGITLPAPVRNLLGPDDGVRPPADPAPRAISIHVDVSGNDDYVSVPNRTHGFGSGHAAGVLLDLQGDDLYQAPDTAQGVGVGGGVGVLVDAGADGINTFRAGPPSQGSARGTGSIGLLAAQGRHNQFSDGGELGERFDPDPQGGTPPDAFGASLNMASEGNAAPTLTATSAPAAMQAGVPATFLATASDPDGDDLRFCWTFRGDDGDETQCRDALGAGPHSASVDHTWNHVPTDGRGVAGAARNFTIDLEVRDAGGLGDSETGRTVTVTNAPPVLADALRGPLQPTLGAGAAPAVSHYQLPVAPDDDLDEVRYSVRWGDGTPPEQSAGLVDWAGAGGTITLPQRLSDADRTACAETSTLPLGLDGSDDTFAWFRYGGGCHFVHALVEFAGPRQVSEVRLAASVGPVDDPVRFSVEGVRTDGTVLPMGIVSAQARRVAGDPSFEPDAFAFTLPQREDLAGLVIRHLPDGELGLTFQALNLHSIQALGHGVQKAWKTPGTFTADVEVLDAFGGRNGTTATVRVTDSSGPGGPPDDGPGRKIEDTPVRFMAFSSRGTPHHASIAAGAEYSMHLRLDDAPGSVCVDWGDDSPNDCVQYDQVDGQDLTARHAWTLPGEYTVSVEHWPAGKAAETTVLTLDVETALDLFVDSDDGEDGGWRVDAPLEFTVPIMYLSLHPQDQRTWYSGTPYSVIVDAAGDDRYAGAVATPQRFVQHVVAGEATSQIETGGRPALVVDVLGDDDYLATEPGAQGFGFLASAALLLDATGNDLYVAPSHAQGAGLKHGAGALVDLGGNDRFNPVDASAPSVASGLPDHPEPWTQRPTALTAGRPPTTPPGPLLQGAGMEGVGLLLMRGGADQLSAGAMSQGFGGHGATALEEYVLPHPGCHDFGTADSPDPGVPDDPTDVDGYFNDGSACFTGVRDPTNFGPAGIPEPDIDRLSSFVLTGPRYGPAAGALVHLDGAMVARGTDQSQAAAAPGGRGLLADADGASVLVAQSRSQAYSDSGYALLGALGPSVLRLGTEGQAHASTSPDENPEPTEAPVATLVVTAGRSDRRCGDCNASDPTAVPAGDALAPSLSWSQSPPASTTAPSLELTVDITPVHPAGRIEWMSVAFATTPAGSGCPAASPLAPAAILDDGSAPTATAGPLVVRLDTRVLLDDGPLLPHGCMDVRVFARQTVEGAPPSAWTVLPATILVLPPPSVQGMQANVASSGGMAAVPLHIPQPLAANAPLVVNLAAAPVGTGAPPGAQQTITSWTPAPGGADATFSWSPDSQDPDGQYVLWHQSRWDTPGVPMGPWMPVAGTRLDLDRSTPTGGFDGLPPTWAAGKPLEVAGTIQAQLPPAAVEVRLLHDGNLVALKPPHAAGVAMADILEATAGVHQWSVTLQADDAFPGGTVVAQATVYDAAGVGWILAEQDVLLDRAAPSLSNISSASGAPATNREFPIPINATLSDAGRIACNASCAAGSGVDPATVAALVLVDGQLHPLRRLEDTSQAGNATTVPFLWEGGDGPEAGTYEVFVQGRDHAGNLLMHSPGAQLTVDRIDPFVSDLQVILPADQTAVKPGDVVAVEATIRDPGARSSGVHVAKAIIVGGATPLDPLGDDRYGASVAIPDTGADGPATIRVAGRDGAGNLGSASQDVQVHGLPLAIEDLVTRPRTDQLQLSWETTRDAQPVHARLDGPDGPVEGVVEGGPTEFLARFDGLAADTEYTLDLALRDVAGWVATLQDPLRTLPVTLGTLALDPPPANARSGEVVITGTVHTDQAVPVTLTLHRDGGDAVDRIDIPSLHGTRTFSLAWDSTVLASGTASLSVSMDDGSTLRTRDVQVVVDNVAPELHVDLEAPSPNNGWYNGSVRARFATSDGSLPVTVQASGGAALDPAGTVFSDDRVHVLEVVARDAAVPPNEATVLLEVPVDRTAPTVQVRRPEAPVASSALPLDVAADDPLSGVHGYRLAVDRSWSPWSAEPPAEAPLGGGEGERWIAVEVRDAAGNVHRESFTVLVDRSPPEILAARWTGVDAEGTPVLHVVGRDTVAAGPLSAGVAAVRFLVPGPDAAWGPWQPTSGNDAFAVAATVGQSVRIQFRDAAGNAGEATDSPALPPPRPVPDPQPAPDDPPGGQRISSSLLSSAIMEPAQVRAGQPVAFSVMVAPLNGTGPSAVWVEVAGERHAMNASGPALGDGRQLYTASVMLEPTPLAEPYVHRFAAEFDGQTTATAVASGPVVLAFDASGPQGNDRKSPAPAAAGLLVLVAAALVARVRRWGA